MMCVENIDESELAEVITTFVQYGAQPNKVDNQGNSALFYARQRQNYDAVNLLISKGCDYGLRNEDGDSIFSLALLDGDEAQVTAMKAKYSLSEEEVSDIYCNKLYEGTLTQD